MKRAFLVLLCMLLGVLTFLPMNTAAEELENEIYEKSGAAGLYDSLEPETQELLSEAGADTAATEGFDLKKLFTTVSGLLRDKISAPLKAIAALTAVIILSRLSNCFESGGVGAAVNMVGATACACIVITPLAELINSAGRVLEAASVFLLAGVPVYSALMVASGSATAGTSYSFLALAAGNSIPILSTGLLLPIMRVFLVLAIATCASSVKLDKLTSSLYNFSKWALTFAVTLFSGLLSAQTLITAQVDAATNKTAKLIASTAIPIVGGAFGDAISAIQSSLGVVKSGVGAFGMLASIFTFAPIAIEALLWVSVCMAGQIVADIFEASKISALLSACASAARMVLAVIASTCLVCVVCAAMVLFVKGSL